MASTSAKCTSVEIVGFDDFANYADKVDPAGPPVFFYFSGSKTSAGVSWCPDCVEAEPVVHEVLNEIEKQIIFVHVNVGEREYWKDLKCPFRTDKRCRLMVIPTMLKWKGVQRLEGGQLTNKELLKLMFEEEED